MPLIGASTCGAPRGGLGQRDEGALQRGQQVAPDRVAVDAVLDLDDRAVEQVQQVVVARADFLGHHFAGGQVLAAGDVAEEVRLALGTGREQQRRLGGQAAEDLGQRIGDGAVAVAEARRGQAALAGLLQVGQLLQVLLGAEVALELGDEAVERTVQRLGAAELLAEQVEAAVDQRLLLGDGRRGVVVGARVGDAAAEDVLVLVDDHRLGGGRAEVDADEAAHGVLRSVWRRAAPSQTAPPRGAAKARSDKRGGRHFSGPRRWG